MALPPETGHRETILLAEDHSSLREYTGAVLRELDYRVYEACDGEEALAIAGEHLDELDLLLTDVVMPRMGGKRLASALAERLPRIRVLYMSGHAEDVMERHGLLSPGIVVLEKPFSPEQLEEKLRRLLDQRERAPSILVVDDDAMVRDLLCLMLAGHGYEVTPASGGQEALHYCRSHAVDLMITDLCMPSGEGLETIRQLRREQPAVRVMAISGAFRGEFLKFAEKFGARAVLRKPIGRVELLEKVRAVLA